MTIKTNNLQETIDHVFTLLAAYEPDTDVHTRKTWANERVVELTHLELDKNKTYDIEFSLSQALETKPFIAAAVIIEDWLSYVAQPTGRVCPSCHGRWYMNGQECNDTFHLFRPSDDR